MRPLLSLLPIILLLAFGCESEKTTTPTKGYLHVLAGESIGPAVILQAKEFMRLYEKNGAHVTYSLVSSEHAVSRFILDTIRTIFTSFPLNALEREAVQRSSGPFLEMVVAYDALVTTVHYKNAVEQITIEEIRKILEGSITRWNQLSHSKGEKGTIKIFLQDSSDEWLYVRQRVLHGRNIPVRFHRTSSPLNTLLQIVNDSKALGFVGLSWIDSAKVPAKTLEVAAAQPDADTTFRPPVESVGKFYTPHPAHIYRNYYPMKRAVYMYTRSLVGDVASGFGTFVANKEGQRIFLERDLVPGTQPIRLKRPD